jgi:hypothetical protein
MEAIMRLPGGIQPRRGRHLASVLIVLLILAALLMFLPW